MNQEMLVPRKPNSEKFKMWIEFRHGSFIEGAYYNKKVDGISLRVFTEERLSVDHIHFTFGDFNPNDKDQEVISYGFNQSLPWGYWDRKGVPSEENEFPEERIFLDPKYEADFKELGEQVPQLRGSLEACVKFVIKEKK